MLHARHDTRPWLILPARGATLPFPSVAWSRALMSAAPPELRGQAGGVNLTIQMLAGPWE